MTDIESAPAAYREACAAFVLLRHFGFVADDIYLLTDSDSVYVGLQTQGKEFLLRLGLHFLNPDEAKKTLEEVVDQFKSMNSKKAAQIFKQSAVAEALDGLVISLMSKGIIPPKVMN